MNESILSRFAVSMLLTGSALSILAAGNRSQIFEDKTEAYCAAH
jgi:hypothetical protein